MNDKVIYMYNIYGVKLFIVGDLVCRIRLTHRKPSHQFLDDLSYRFTTLDGVDTPSVGL